MSRLQWFVLFVAVTLLFTLYFGCPTKPPNREQIDAQRAKQAATIDLNKLIERASGTYPPQQLQPILALERQLADTLPDETTADLFKDISRNWNQLGDFALGGMYAEKVAEVTQSDSAWSIVGTTFFSGFKRDRDSLIRSFCMSKAIAAFESAISLAPDDPVHTVNLGLCYVEGGQQPMRGITIIRDAAEKYPDHPLPSMTLGRMSVRTGQYDKAVQRFDHVLTLEPSNTEAHYWLGISHKALNNPQQAAIHLQKFIALSDDDTKKKEVENVLRGL